MSMWFYSTEAIPSPALLGKPGYTPEIPTFLGMHVTINEKQWTEMPAYYPTLTHRDWTDKRGTAHRVYSDDIVKGLKPLYEKRGVIFLDHEPSTVERETFEKLSAELNLQHRADVIRNFEEQIAERQVTGKGRSKPTPYENECYDMLQMPKPYSPEALRTSRDPGASAAEKIANAMVEALKRDREEVLAMKVPAKTTK